MAGKAYKCLFNHELLILGTACSPYQSYDDDIKDEQVTGFINELENTDVDVIMCCPTAWRRNLWYSQVDRHWQDEAPFLKEPLPEHDWKYYEKAYFRLRRYMLKGSDPVGVSLKAAHDVGKAFFISYRMNDHHYLDKPDNPNHNTFWRSHPEYRFSPIRKTGGAEYGFLNYERPEVRDYYFSILKELADLYDIDGLELDFMRSPAFFPDPVSGMEIMTGFVREIRTMLDELSAQRNKMLQLCVRVPHRFWECAEAGLDVSRWGVEGLVDMVNISSFYINDLNLEIENYRKNVPNVQLFGEMHFIVDSGEMPEGFSNNITRKTSREMYYAMAENYLCRGADGLSLFNFDYVRNHYFNEPRRLGLTGCEPQFELLRGITDRRLLSDTSKHYYWRAESLNSSQTGCVSNNLYIPGESSKFVHAILRVVTKEPFKAQSLSVLWNGTKLDETMWYGELFPPLTLEALPPIQNMRFFEMGLPLLNKGINTLVIQADDGRMPHLKCVDLGLYKK